jgi:predicted heme/steroid binding protein
MKLRKTIGIFSLVIMSGIIWYVSYTMMSILYFDANIIDNPNTGDVTTTYDYTPETLSKYNGLNGQPAYIALKGKVYDVSKLPLWKAGSHFGMIAGVDLTSLFSKSPHDISIIDRAVELGTFGSNTGGTTPVDTQPSFTLIELSKYNGTKGQPSYIALNGIVYDVSGLVEWKLGQHYGGVKSGTDITLAFPNSPHTFTILNRAKMVGVLEGDSPKVTPDMLNGTGEDDDEGDDD